MSRHRSLKWCMAIMVLLNATVVCGQVSLAPYTVQWTSQSINSSGSMPMGNGDIGANIWVDQEGVLQFYISKTDSHSEIGRLLKIGKIALRFSPNILAEKEFTQTLDLEKGMIRISGKKEEKTIEINCWIDANNPVIHVEGNANFPLSIDVINQLWRKDQRLLTGNERHSGYGVTFRDEPFLSEKDTVLQFNNAIGWCHENKSSIWQMTLDNQNISAFNAIGKDPLLGQQFGAIVGGKEFKKTSAIQLSTIAPTKHFAMYAVVQKSNNPSIENWKQAIEKKLENPMKSAPGLDLNNHVSWWKAFWNRHYIIISSDSAKEKTFEITQAYTLQRYINACAGRGGLPIKFNGSIFTVDLNENMGSGKKGFDADYREWGGNFWFQNTRLIYWTMLHAGDHEMMKPFFDMYSNALALAKFRTKKYFNHEGAYFPETMTPWGSYLIDKYGWNRKNKPDGVSDNLYIRYYWQGGLELCAMMFDYLEFTKDSAYFKSKAVPFIKEIIAFYDKHYARDEKGKLLITPAQSLETYQEGVTNPAPEIGGLHWCLDQILNKPGLFESGFLNQSKRFKKEIPSLPISDSLGQKILLSGENLGKRLNIENPELYAVFPYRIFGVGKPELPLALNTFSLRGYKSWQGWHQDAIQAALLGLTAEAKKMVTSNFTTKQNSSRFPAFWGPNYDWVPDQDHGSVSSRALQNMLVQTNGDEVLLFPAWPKEWNVQFKIHIPGKKTIEGSYHQRSGVIIKNKPAGIQIKTLIN